MGKGTLTKLIAKDMGVTPAQAHRFLSSLVKHSVRVLNAGESWNIGLGPIKRKVISRDPRTGAVTYGYVFTAGKALAFKKPTRRKAAGTRTARR